MPTSLLPIELPEWVWQQAEVREALRARNVGGLFRLVQRYSGASQARVATAVSMTQSRVNEIMNGRRDVSRLDVFERIADGLAMPDSARHLLGLASRRVARPSGSAFDLAAFPEVVRVYASQASATEDIQRQAQSADELDVLAVRGLGLIGLKDSLLRSAITDRPGAGLRTRVLLLDPNAPALVTRAAEIGESAESLSGGVTLAEARLRELAQQGHVEVYRYRTLPTWRLIRLDTTLWISAFDAGWEGHESATYKVMKTPSGPLYRGFRRMFQAILEESERTV